MKKSLNLTVLIEPELFCIKREQFAAMWTGFKSEIGEPVIIFPPILATF